MWEYQWENTNCPSILCSLLKKGLWGKSAQGGISCFQHHAITHTLNLTNIHSHSHTHTHSLWGLSSATSDSKALFMVVKLRAAGWRFGSSSCGIGLFLDEENTPLPPPPPPLLLLLPAETDTCSSSCRNTPALLVSACRSEDTSAAPLSFNNSRFYKSPIVKNKFSVLLPCVPVFIQTPEPFPTSSPASFPVWCKTQSLRKYRLAGELKHDTGFSGYTVR